MANYDIAFDASIGIEGSNWELSPNDNGSWTGGSINKGICVGTKYGITATDLANILGRDPSIEDMKSLTIEQVKQYNKPIYWDVIRGDEITNQENANKLFESCYNAGVKTAIAMIQEALGVPITKKMDDTTLNALNSL
jgi:lysozyme family protein